jgi:predicted RNA-binding protein YlxR (DUF448 family)
MKTKSISKHTSQRTCVACRTVNDKRELVRLVRVKDGIAEIDDSGRKNGRGAYLCRRQKCWQEGLKGSRLEQALRTALKPENKKRLIEYGSSIQGD